MLKHLRRGLAVLAAAAVLVGVTAAPAAADPFPGPWPAPNWFEVINRNSYQCMEIVEGRTAAGAYARQWPCARADHQQWRVRSSNDPARLLLKVRHTDFCLTSLGGWAFQIGCNGDPRQNWSQQFVSTYDYAIHDSAGQCLQVENASTTAGAGREADHLTGAPNQLWFTDVLPR